MIKQMEKGRIIGMKESGKSNREIARITGHNRKTISKMWNEYRLLMLQLQDPGADVKTIQAQLTEEPKYDSTGQKRRKFTIENERRLKEIVVEERKKDRLMGAGHKQKLTNKQIHDKLLKEGFDISGVTINNALAEMRKKQKEVFIRQTYDLGDRLEYDFGEVKLDCGE